MENFFKKYVPVTIGALMATSPLLADMDSRIGKLESQMKDCGTQTARGNFGARTASARADVDGYGFYLTADALLWTVYNSDNAYVTNDSDTAVSGITGATSHYNYDWAWGFRAGLGYYAEHDQWTTDLVFTWFKDTANARRSVVSPASLIQQFGNPDTWTADETVYSHSRANGNLTFYDLAWRIGRDFFVSKYLALNPYVGIRTTWFYENRSLRGNDVESTVVIKQKDKNDFWGVGPSAGLDARMYFGKHWNMYAKTSAALLWGKFDVSSRSKDVLLDTTTDNTSAGKHGIVPNVQLALGLGYNTNFMDDNFNFGINLGYESSFYFGEDQMLQWNSANRIRYANGNKAMHGFNLNMMFSF
jgi:hypothetical protein